jgi:phosphodiesterase/alkaline phosphatase D-like protein
LQANARQRAFASIKENRLLLPPMRSKLLFASAVAVSLPVLWALAAGPIARISPKENAFVDRGPWVGAVTATSAVVKVRISTPEALTRLSVAEESGIRTAFFTEVQTVPSSRIAKFELKNLKPLTHYLYNIEVNGRFERGTLGQFTTFPAGAASFTFAFASCARTASAHLVFRTIRENRPLFFMNIGDFHYSNINSDNPERFYAAYDEVLTSAPQAELYRNVPFVYIWDDHDYGGNNSSRTAASHFAARKVYNDYVPHYPLAAGPGDVPIYQAFTVGRIRFVLTDLRSERTPDGEKDTPEKTMMGRQQKAWFKQELLNSSGRYPVIFWVSTVPWIGTAGVDVYSAATNVDGLMPVVNLLPRAQQQFNNRKRDPWLDDYWAGFAFERVEIANFVKEHHIRGLCILHGDAHMLAADNGSHSDYATGGGASIPVLAAAPLDQDGSIKGGPYSQGVYKPLRGEGCFGLVTVLDRGDKVRVVYSGRNQFNHEKIGLTFEVPASASGPNAGPKR